MAGLVVAGLTTWQYEGTTAKKKHEHRISYLTGGGLLMEGQEARPTGLWRGGRGSRPAFLGSRLALRLSFSRWVAWGVRRNQFQLDGPLAALAHRDGLALRLQRLHEIGVHPGAVLHVFKCKYTVSAGRQVLEREPARLVRGGLLVVNRPIAAFLFLGDQRHGGLRCRLQRLWVLHRAADLPGAGADDDLHRLRRTAAQRQTR